jgi:uncharacterized 2Fe-2S/4Fe-4S cluster protein (DUF4445 family)
MDFLTRRNALVAGVGFTGAGLLAGCAASGIFSNGTSTVSTDLTTAATMVTALNDAILAFVAAAGNSMSAQTISLVQKAQGYISQVNAALTAAASATGGSFNPSSITSWLAAAMQIVASLGITIGAAGGVERMSAELRAANDPAYLQAKSKAQALVSAWVAAHPAN